MGHFAFGMEKANGQTIKTKIVGAELAKKYGDEQVGCFDTMGGWRFLCRLPRVLHSMLKNHECVVLLPAYKAVCIIMPLIVLMNQMFHRKIFYVVIGGRLPLLLHKFPWLKRVLKKVTRIYPETQLMAKELKAEGVENVTVMPNCKPLEIIEETQQHALPSPPYKLCTFSRVSEEKGIADAVNAVRECNRMMGKKMFVLHIYGQIEEPEWFDGLMGGQPEEIQYKGVVPFSESVKVLRDYFALVFPTYYRGEAFAGTLIDALAAGLPVIASDWHANGELVNEGETGMLFPVRSVDALIGVLVDVAGHPEKMQRMRRGCLQRATEYQPYNAMRPLFGDIDADE